MNCVKVEKTICAVSDTNVATSRDVQGIHREAEGSSGGEESKGDSGKYSLCSGSRKRRHSQYLLHIKIQTTSI